MRKQIARSQAKIKIPLDIRLNAAIKDHLPSISARQIYPLPTKAVLLTARQTKTLLTSPIIQRSKKNLLLMKEINPLNRPQSASESSQGSRIMRRLDSGKQSKILPELVILKVNQDKRSYLKQPLVRESLIGQQAVNKFYQRYKNLDKRKQQQDFLNQKHVLTHIVGLLQMHNFTPRKLTLVKLKGEDAILDLRKLGIGQGSMGPVVTQIMNYLQKFEQIDLSYNRIDVLLGQALIQKLAKVKKIDLSHNRIGKIGCQKFSELFLDPYTRIEELSLEENNLLDSAGVSLVQNLHKYGTLKKLNLNKNYLGQRFAQKLKQYLGGNDRNLAELYISWNQFNSKGVKAVLEGVLEHSYLRVFDFSWNKIEEQNIQLLAQIFQQAESLVHCDFSFCQIRLKSVAVLSKSLSYNHTLFGLHFEGNSGFIDHKGFLIQTQKQFYQFPLPIIRGVIRRIDGVKPYPNNQFRGGNMRDVCWICHSWQQKYFYIDFNEQIKKFTKGSPAECFIHFKHQNYTAVKMFLSDDGCKFELSRMCPTGSIQFFFTISIGLNGKKIFVSRDYQKIYQQQKLRYFIGKIEIKQTIFCRNNQLCQYEVDPIDETYVPSIEIAPRSPEVSVTIYLPQIANKQGKKIAVKKQRIVVKEEKMKVNLKDLETDDDEFLKDKQDRDGDEEYLKRCIQFDIANSKILKVIKDNSDLQKFKQMMVSHYRHFKDAFYYLAHSNPSIQNIFTISELEFTGFLQEQKYITKRVNQAKVMLKLYACLSIGDDQQKGKKDKKIQDKNNNKLISRPQFLEFLIRLAIQKWCYNPHKRKKPAINKDLFWEEEDLKLIKNRKNPDKIQRNESKFQKQVSKKQVKLLKPVKQEIKDKNQQIKEDQEQEDEEEDQQIKKNKIQLPLSLIAGIERTMTTLTRYAENYKSSQWRKLRYLKIDILIVIKAYQQFLNSLFDKYSQSKFKTNKSKRLFNLLTLDQLRSLMMDTDIRKTKEAMKEVDQAFLDSKRLEIEDGNLQYGLNYDQFLQCICRISEIVWFNPPSAPNAELWNIEVNRKNTPLFLRFQSLIIALYWRTPELHNRRMTKISDKGIFEVQIGLIMEKIQNLSKLTGSFGLIRKNSILGEQDISLKDINQQLRQRFDKMIIRREMIEEYQIEQELPQ